MLNNKFLEKTLILVISGPSGSGKSTLCKKILEDNFNFKLSVSLTTRKKRTLETNGIEYNFTTKEEFQNMINNLELIEYAKIYENFYGTHKSTIENSIKGRYNLLFDINPIGNFAIKEYCKNIRNIIFINIYVMPPSIEELKQRLISRGDAIESINLRLSHALEEMKFSHQYDYIITNINIENSYAQIKKILEKYFYIY
ncbi:MAG: guanylate kinase [Rickettsiales bacterium]